VQIGLILFIKKHLLRREPLGNGNRLFVVLRENLADTAILAGLAF